MARRCAVLIAVVCTCLLSACGRAPRAGASGPSITDAWGRTVTLAAPARRVVSLAPATTELVFALGAGDRLVGRTAWCDWPAAAASVADVGNGIGPNVEAVAGRRPDLVLLYPSEANRAALAQFDQLGIPVAVLDQDAVAEWRQAARLVGILLEREAAAESLLADFDRRLEAARATRSAVPTVFIAAGSAPPIAIGRGSFLSELVDLAGGANVFDSILGPSGVVSLEAVVARDPDAVLALGPASVADDLARRPGWRVIGAVRGGRVITVDGGEYNRPSPRLPEAVVALRSRLERVRAACYPAGRRACAR